MDTQAKFPRENSLPHLRKLWQEAVADESDGLDPERVFKRLEENLKLHAKKRPDNAP